jgi:hypothetical protein
MRLQLSFTYLFLLLVFALSNNGLQAQTKDSIVQFIFTSDLHFGLSKTQFRNQQNVSAVEVNKAMVEVMNQMPNTFLPKDNGVEAGNKIEGVDALVITGDIANRMESGIQSATTSWAQFKSVYIDALHLKKRSGAASSLYLVPGNHDMSNAIGFHRPMEPKKDPATMLGIYNLMFPEKQTLYYDSSLNRVHYAKDINGIHLIFLSLYPDSAERVWMEQDLSKVSTSTPVFLFAHSMLEVEPRFFENPNGIHDINDEDKFENLVPERYKDGKDVKGVTTIEQNELVAFLAKHANIKVYFHGHENFTQYYTYHGPNKDLNLTCIRTDSPMKGRVSSKDESKLAFELVSINTHSQMLTVREILWNNPATTIPFTWGQSANHSLK